MCPLIYGFSQSLSAKLIQVVSWNSDSSFVITEWYSIEWTYHELFVHLTVNGHLDCLQLRAVVNYVVVNILVCDFGWVQGPISIGCTHPGVEVLGHR